MRVKRLLANQKYTKVMRTYLQLGFCCTYNKQIFAFANRPKGTESAGQEYSLFLWYIFLRPFLFLIMGPSSVLLLSEDVLMLLLHNMDLLDLCVHDEHLQRVKGNNMKDKITYS